MRPKLPLSRIRENFAHELRGLMRRTLTGEDAAVDYPLMPVIVKTPTCPLVIARPADNAPDEWEVSGAAPNLEAAYKNKEGRLIGFALSGTQTQHRQDWVKKCHALPHASASHQL